MPLKERSEFHCPPVDEAWPIAKPLIQKALDRGSNYTIDEIYEGLKSQAMQLWMYGDEAAMVTTIQNRDDQRWCLLLALGGSGADLWVRYLPIVESWAKDNGCQEMRIYGRIGWARHTGYNIDYTKMSKRL